MHKNIMRTVAMTAIMAFSATWANAAEPEGYYSTAYGRAGKTLLARLHDIIDDHHNVGYDGLWQVYYTSDVREDGTLWDMYSTKHWQWGKTQCGNYKNVGDCYNREHSMPKSWFDDRSPMVSDAFHIYPTDGKVNGQRSNYPYGECSGGTNLGTYNGVKALGKLGACTFPGYSGTVFEPDDEYKGDFARTYFYMATRYNDLIAGWDSPMLAGNSYPAFTTWAVNLLLKWNEQDPVSEKEIKRNDAVYVYQGNRNPFIDYPELVDLIWGDRYGDEWMPGEGPVDPDPIDPNPVDPDPVDPNPVDPSELTEYEYTFKSGDVTTSGGTAKWGNATWTASSAPYAGWGDKRGCQIGSGNKPADEWTISTDAFSGLYITEVTVSACTASKGSATVSAKVDDRQLGDEAEIGDSGVTDCIFSGDEKAGTLSITFSNNAQKAMYISSIKVKARKNTSAIATPTATRHSAIPTEGGVIITTGSEWTPVTIHSADGIRWFGGEVAESERFDLEPGLYIVRIADRPYRILVK